MGEPIRTINSSSIQRKQIFALYSPSILRSPHTPSKLLGSTSLTPSPKKKVIPVVERSDEPDIEEIPKDAEVGLQLLRQQFPRHFKNIPPILLKTQLYSILNDRTELDKELDRLVKIGKIRIFKLINFKDEYAYVYTRDYIDYIKDARDTCIKDPESVNLKILDLFFEKVISNHYDVSITKESLLQLIGPMSDSDMRLLVNLGVIIMRDESTFWFSIPNIGPFVKAITKARSEILLTLQRKKYKEMLIKDIENKKLRSSPLGVKFHLRDIIGHPDLVLCVPTTSGTLMRYK